MQKSYLKNKNPSPRHERLGVLIKCNMSQIKMSFGQLGTSKISIFGKLKMASVTSNNRILLQVTIILVPSTSSASKNSLRLDILGRLTLHLALTMARYVHPHPQRHAIGVSALELYSQFQVAELLWNASGYCNAAAIFFLINYYLC